MVSVWLLRLALLVMAGAVSACGTGAPSAAGVTAAVRQPGINCAPFARELSGVALYGEAADWWGAAAGRYGRGRAPQIGAVLVLPRQERLPSGHVAVVSLVLAARQIKVIQANWEKDVVDHCAVQQLPPPHLGEGTHAALERLERCLLPVGKLIPRHAEQ